MHDRTAEKIGIRPAILVTSHQIFSSIGEAGSDKSGAFIWTAASLGPRLANLACFRRLPGYKCDPSKRTGEVAEWPIAPLC
jgi:hypothetical protein